jgi:elongation factor G
MADIEIEKLRNVAVVGHGKAGKTTLVESMLFLAGATDRLGRVEDGSSVTDFEPEEIERRMSLTSALAYCEYGGVRFNLIDTPGFINFLEDTHGSMRAADGAVVMVSAISGVKGETEKVMGFASEFGIPKLVYINKLDKEGADFRGTLESVKRTFRSEIILLQQPIGVASNFKGIIDLLTMKAFLYENGRSTEVEVPAELRAEAESCRNDLVERVAESNDALLEKYLEGDDLTDAEILAGLTAGSIASKFIPIVCGDPHTGLGTDQLFRNIVRCLPSPLEIASVAPMRATMADGTEVECSPDPSGPFAAYVFKTVADPFAGKLNMFRVFSGTWTPDVNVHNSSSDTKERMGQVFYMQGKKQEVVQKLLPGEIGVVAKLKNTNTGDTLCSAENHASFPRVKFAEPLISYAIAPRTKGEEDKVSTALHRTLDEDPTLRFTRHEETHDMVLSGMGQSHLEYTLEKIKRKFGVEVEMHAPKIPYRETVKAKATAQGKYKKQSGGKGQYGDCHITVEPNPGVGYEFVDAIVGGSIPRNFIPAVDKGIQEAMAHGPYSGYPMVDVKVTVFDGSYHAVDSSEMAFKVAGSMALKKCLETAKPVVLEPIMKVDITTPDEFLGTVIGDLNSRRGRVQGMDQIEGATTQKVVAMVPMSEMLTYANQLQSMTAGRGVYAMEFAQYEELPANLTQKLLEEKEKAGAE